MEKIVFDSGVKEYQINDDGVLRFNPTDPNVYNRFFMASEKIKAVEDRLVARGAAVGEDGQKAIEVLAEADRDTKAILAEVFGEGNDFDKMLGGVNMMAVGDNGERIITNFLHALTPIMQDGAERCMAQDSAAAVEQAKANRAQRRAAERK